MGVRVVVSTFSVLVCVPCVSGSLRKLRTTLTGQGRASRPVAETAIGLPNDSAARRRRKWLAMSAASSAVSRCRSRSCRIAVIALALAVIALATQPADAGSFAAPTYSEYRQVRTEVEAAIFLSRATFGPTKSDITALATRIREIGRLAAFDEWIETQFALPATSHRATAYQILADDGYAPGEPSIGVARYRQYAWWHIAVNADDQLRQRTAWALSQIFVLAGNGDGFSTQLMSNGHPGWVGPVNYYDDLVDHAFGNYRDAMGDVAVSPLMGVSLSHLQNRKADPATGRFPDENFAREVMQLFSIGTTELSSNGTPRMRRGRPVETYTNAEVREFARVFTGLRYADAAGGSIGPFVSPRNFESPMVVDPAEHDMGAKTLLRGTVLPAGQSGMQDIAGALDNLFTHPNCAPFVARRLIQRLVKSNPSKGYIYRVVRVFRDNGQGQAGDMKAVLKAILLDREAVNSIRRRGVRDAQGVFLGLLVTPRTQEFSALREPVLRFTAMMRAFDAASDYPGGWFMIEQSPKVMKQSPYSQPSVFNFYLPDHTPQGALMDYRSSRKLSNRRLVAPEFQIYTTDIANVMANQFIADLSDGKITRNLYHTNGRPAQMTITLDYSEEKALAAAGDLDGLLSHLDLVLCSGTLSDGARQVIVDAMASENLSSDEEAMLSILLVALSPDCVISN